MVGGVRPPQPKFIKRNQRMPQGSESKIVEAENEEDEEVSD